MIEKKRLVLGIVVILLLTTGLASAGTVELRFGHVAAQGSMLYEAGEKFKQNVEEMSGGEITVSVFPGGQLGNLPQMMGQLKKGSLDLLKSDYGLVMILDGGKPFVVGFFPYLFRDQAHLQKFIDSPLFAEMMGQVEQTNGLTWLGLVDPRSPRALTTRSKKVVTPDDLKGQKIRVPKVAGIPESFEAWGASTAVIAATELYSSLKQKVVDGQENGLDVVAGFKLYEVQKYYTALDYCLSAEGIWMNQAKFESLTPEQREIMKKAAASTYGWSSERLAELTAGWEKECQDNGMTIVRPPLEPWIQSSRKVIADLDGKAFPQGLYDKIHSIE